MIDNIIYYKNLEGLFYENHVNLVISGHVHAYERSFPVFKNRVRTDGVTYITIGDAGNHEGIKSFHFFIFMLLLLQSF